MFDILSIDIQTGYKDFSRIVDDVLADESSNRGCSFDLEVKTSQLTKSKKTMYKLVFKNNDSGDVLNIVAESSGNDIIFKPLKLNNFNNSFYTNTSDGDLEETVLNVLKKIALKSKGTLACIYNDDKYLFRGGRDMTNHIVSYGLIDDEGKIYCINSDKIQVEDDDDDDMSSAYVPRYLLNDWLDENIEFQNKLLSLKKTERFELMGQFAIYQKRKNMITADQFRDLIIQIGTFADMLGGFKDESLKNIYQFFI